MKIQEVGGVCLQPALQALRAGGHRRPGCFSWSQILNNLLCRPRQLFLCLHCTQLQGGCLWGDGSQSGQGSWPVLSEAGEGAPSTTAGIAPT